MKKQSMNEAYLGYRDAVYPAGVSEIQNREVHQAFFAGALIAFELMTSATTHPNETEAALLLEKACAETEEVCRQKIQCAKDRN